MGFKTVIKPRADAKNYSLYWGWKSNFGHGECYNISAFSKIKKTFTHKKIRQPNGAQTNFSAANTCKMSRTESKWNQWLSLFNLWIRSRLQNSRFRKAGSAVSVILECEAREPHTPAVRIWSEYGSNMVRGSRSQKNTAVLQSKFGGTFFSFVRYFWC